MLLLKEPHFEKPRNERDGDEVRNGREKKEGNGEREFLLQVSSIWAAQHQRQQKEHSTKRRFNAKHVLGNRVALLLWADEKCILKGIALHFVALCAVFCSLAYSLARSLVYFMLRDQGSRKSIEGKSFECVDKSRDRWLGLKSIVDVIWDEEFD